MRMLPVICGLSLLLFAGSAAAQSRDLQRLQDAHQALSELRVEDADAELQQFDSGVMQSSVAHLRALVRFYQGRYGEASVAMQESLSLSPARQVGDDSDPRTSMAQLIEDTRAAMLDYQQTTSEDGRFIVRYGPGRDAQLVPYALDVLARTDAALEEELGYRVPGPIRLEIYPDANVLAQVSSLTVENIETSGTIALCKWDRLMVTSPRALLRGYPWMDTIAHEFVHLVLTRLTQDRAPVWVQEGLAKFLERRWRQTSALAAISPGAAGLLREAAASDSLLPFERLHPSIALLPSQEQAALAFAQVSSFMALYHSTYGRSRLQSALTRMREGDDAREALAQSAERTFDALEQTWIRSLRAPEESGDSPAFMGVQFRGSEADSLSPAAQRRLRLGDMLWARERFGAAAREYEAGLLLVPSNPMLAARLARASLASGRPNAAELAIATLEPLAARHPDYAPARAYLGSAYRAAGRNAECVTETLAAIGLNPFDPRPHCDLAATSDEERVQRRERTQCATLGGESP